MSRLSRTRVAAATGLTLGAAAAGLILAPVASAAPLPAPTLSPTTVAPGAQWTVSGTGCVSDWPDTTPVVAILPAVDPQWADTTDAAADGSWSFTRTAPTEVGTYEFSLICDRYATDDNYTNVTLTVGVPFVAGAVPNTPGIVVTKNTSVSNVAKPGQQITQVYKGFKPNEKVTLVLHSTPVNLGTFTADADGVVTATFTLPEGTALATHTLAYDGDQGSHFEVAITLTADGKALAYTGTSIAVPLVTGSVLLAAGAGALVVARRRRPAGAVQA